MCPPAHSKGAPSGPHKHGKMMKLIAGLDIGSVSVKFALLDAAGKVSESTYIRHQGRPLEMALPLLEGLVQRHGPVRLALTGSSAKLLAESLGLPHVNELLALALAMRAWHPEVRTVMEMGGEDAKLLLLENGGVRDFALNSVCAAGTGSFLDQQAERMRLSIEEFAALAMKSATPPRIAGRCSVFAKSDMIHLQQIATPLHDIVAGLCFAVARNFKGSIVRNRVLLPKVAFLGGVALNKGVVRGFKEVFGLEDLFIPPTPTILAAGGAALKLRESAADSPPLDAGMLARLKRGARNSDIPRKGRLLRADDGFMERHALQPCNGGAGSSTPKMPGRAYLGVDIGSISTCLAVVDQEGRLVARRYLRTASRPIEAVRQGLRELRQEFGADMTFHGVGTTGSGRYMIADCIGADLVKNEITAQARGAVSLDQLLGGEGVDTVFEIGGQDSKYIQLRDGVIVDFEMNKACAAGTGSFLEEQAEKLDIAVKDEFAALALEADAPCALGERCTVFMENSLMNGLQQGADKPDLLAGLSYSIVENYINRVVAGRAIGDKIFFQGGTACNTAVVAAFEKFLGREITVPPYTDVSGAIGMALLAREHMNALPPDTHSAFKGFGVADQDYEQDSFECKGCDNRCEINKVRFAGEATTLYYGGRCEKYDIRRQAGKHLPDLFALRQEALERAHAGYAARAKGRPKRGVMGLPRVFFLQEYLPYYSALLWELGFEVRLSPLTDQRVAGLGVQSTLAETCYPVKAALGHVRWLFNQGVERIFLPSFVNVASQSGISGQGCPLTQSFPYMARQALASDNRSIVAPVVRMGDSPVSRHLALLERLAPLGVPPWSLRRAMARAEAAQQAFHRELQEAWRELFDSLPNMELERALVVVGRSYNAFDPGMNLGIPRKLATLNTLAIPMDFLPLSDHEEGISRDWPDMYWRSGQRMLQAARVLARDPRFRDLHALVIGSFSCGPDSFILEYFDQEMRGKPYLHIEIDEHSADAGAVTRLEAFLDSLAMRKKAAPPASREQTLEQPNKGRQSTGGQHRVVFIPRMGDQAFGMRAAFQAAGVEAEVMPPTDKDALELAKRYTTGKECFPFAVTLADMLKVANTTSFDPERTAFFMPGGSGPCRFGQYNLLQRIILERAGIHGVRIFSPMQDSTFYKDLGVMGNDFARNSWKGMVAVDLLLKMLHATRPYERVPGSADQLYARALEDIPPLVERDLETLAKALERCSRDFADLKCDSAPRPLIGIVGEIFVRTNAFSNEDLVRQVEALGGEAWLASVDEWVYYVNWGAMRNAMKRRELSKLLQVGLKNHVMRKIGLRLEHSLNGNRASFHDPEIPVLLRKAAPYMHHSFRGEAILSVGKALDMLDRGARGIALAMPFGCMPGTVAFAMLRDICARRHAPLCAIPFDGTASPTMTLQLETFMEQAEARPGKR